MNKRDFNVVGNEGTDNQELAKGIAFIKSRRAELNVVQMVENMRDQAMPNGVIINDAYCDRSITRDYDREALNAFFATLKEEDFEVVVVRSLNEITDDIYDLEEFVKTITDMGINSSLPTCPLREEKSFSQRAFSICTYIRKLQDKAKTSPDNPGSMFYAGCATSFSREGVERVCRRTVRLWPNRWKPSTKNVCRNGVMP